MRVADIGCGAGLTALWMANAVGSTGYVIAVDSSRDQLRIAEQNAAAAGVRNISFLEAGAYDTGLDRASFDLVFSRFLMCHLSAPHRALTEMRSLLKASGVLVCEDHDDGGIFTEPQTRAYMRLVEISRTVNRALGLDSYVGLKLPRLLLEAGFPQPNVRMQQVAFLRGDAKRFWEITLREAAPAILAAQASTVEELESICAENAKHCKGQLGTPDVGTRNTGVGPTIASAEKTAVSTYILQKQVAESDGSYSLRYRGFADVAHSRFRKSR